jgi:hypothetical protein
MGDPLRAAPWVLDSIGRQWSLVLVGLPQRCSECDTLQGYAVRLWVHFPDPAPSGVRLYACTPCMRKITADPLPYDEGGTRAADD